MPDNGNSRRQRIEEIVLQRCTAEAHQWIREGQVDAGVGLLDAALLVADVLASQFGREIVTDRDVAMQELLTEQKRGR